MHKQKAGTGKNNMLTIEKAKTLKEIFKSTVTISAKSVDTGISINGKVYLSGAELKSALELSSDLLITAEPHMQTIVDKVEKQAKEKAIAADPIPSVTAMCKVIQDVAISVPDKTKQRTRSTVINSLCRLRNKAEIADQDWLHEATLVDFVIARISNSEIAIKLIDKYVVDYAFEAEPTFMAAVMAKFTGPADYLVRFRDKLSDTTSQGHWRDLQLGALPDRVRAYDLLKNRVGDALASVQSEFISGVKADTKLDD